MNNFSLSEFIEDIRIEFYKRLDQKTNWGRNEVNSHLDQAIKEICLKVLSEKVTPINDISTKQILND
jgi:hypothetical protein